jgi:secondary thiamine-phosphate synthase enzyme
MIKTLTIQTPGQGLHEFTNQVREVVDQSLTPEGLCTLFIQHTSASMTIQENADPSARRDLEDWMVRNVPEDDPNYTHTTEGPDDMPSHIKAAITSTTLSIPMIDGELALGTWQGIFLWEHRTSSKQRRVVVHISA